MVTVCVPQVTSGGHWEGWVLLPSLPMSSMTGTERRRFLPEWAKEGVLSLARACAQTGRAPWHAWEGHTQGVPRWSGKNVLLSLDDTPLAHCPSTGQEDLAGWKCRPCCEFGGR